MDEANIFQSQLALLPRSSAIGLEFSTRLQDLRLLPPEIFREAFARATPAANGLDRSVRKECVEAAHGQRLLLRYREVASTARLPISTDAEFEEKVIRAGIHLRQLNKKIHLIEILTVVPASYLALLVSLFAAGSVSARLVDDAITSALSSTLGYIVGILLFRWIGQRDWSNLGRAMAIVAITVTAIAAPIYVVRFGSPPLAVITASVVGSAGMPILAIYLVSLTFSPLANALARTVIGPLVSSTTTFAQLIDAAFLVSTRPEGRASSFHARKAEQAIGRAALLVRMMYEPPRRSRIDRDSREWLQAKALRARATLLRHIALLYMPDVTADTVARSLLNGALAVEQGNWTAIGVLDLPTERKSAIRRFLPRLIVAVAVASVGVAIPLVPGLLPDAQAGYIRATLFVAAVFALFVSDPSKLRDTALGLTKDTLGPAKGGSGD